MHRHRPSHPLQEYPHAFPEVEGFIDKPVFIIIQEPVSVRWAKYTYLSFSYMLYDVIPQSGKTSIQPYWKLGEFGPEPSAFIT